MNLTYTQSLEKFEDEKEIFSANHGYELNLDNPQSLNEKIVYKKLFDRNPLLVETADKYKVRDYVKKKAGEKYLKPLLSMDDLKGEYIIKPNHACGWYIVSIRVNGKRIYIIDDKYILKDDKKIAQIGRDWLSSVYGQERNEWAYTQIEPHLIVERFIRDGDRLPKDYRFWMFGGKCKLISVTASRFEGLCFVYYSPNWNILDIGNGKLGFPENKPKVFDEMIELAEKLSVDFDFTRIDLMLANGKIYFGEITHYPASGDARFPKDIDFKLGKYWNVDSDDYNI